MQSKIFWNSWSPVWKSLYTGLIALFVLAMIWMAYWHIAGTDNILDWTIMAKTDYVQTIIDTFKLGPFTLTNAVDSPVFSQQYSGGLPEANALSYYLLLFGSVVCTIILLTVVTTLPRFWYFIGMGLFAILLVNYKLELLLLFQSEQKWGLIIALALYVPTSYYFHSIKSATPFTSRLITFCVISLAMYILILLFSDVEKPFLYLATYGMINPFVIGLLFVLIVSHEIIAAFINVLTSGRPGTNTKVIGHFYIISLIYLINLLMAYLRETNVIDWDFIYINLFLLLATSAILGIWGFKQRESQYSYLFSFYPVGALAFASMGICCFITIAHFMATFNDPGIEVFRDFIIYSHLAFGLIFLVYITSNFLDPLRRGLQVHKILYKPQSMPYFTFQLAGLIAFTALVLKSNWEVPVNQGMSAYYNGLADMHMYNDEHSLAEAYYKEAAIFGYNNHKAHYTLGKLADRKNKHVEAAVYYKAATAKNPTPQSFVNLSNVYLEQSRFFDAVFTLNQGIEAFPHNGTLLNNLGLAYAKTTILDTAAFYLSQAQHDADVSETAGSNILALISKNDLKINADSVVANDEQGGDPISINNSIVLKNKAQQKIESNNWPEDSTLTFLETSIVFNQAFNYLFHSDSLQTDLLNRYIAAPQNINVKEKLELARYLNLYKNGNITKAFRGLNWLANTSNTNGGAYFDILGKWALQQEAPDVAADYFKWAEDRNFKNAQLNQAIAATENTDLPRAFDIWQQLLSTGDHEVKGMASEMLPLLTITPSQLIGASDAQKYLYLRYHIAYEDTVIFNNIVETISSPDYKGKAILDMSQKLWNKDLKDEAIDYYARLAGTQISDKNLFDELQWYELKILAAQGDIRGLSNKINQGVTFDQSHSLEKLYFTALINEANGDSTNAVRNYRTIAFKNPFKEEMTVAAANYLGQYDKFEAYEILINGIELNPNAVILLKAYILQCARVQLGTYAALSLETLKTLISEREYINFVNKYEALVKKIEIQEQNF